MYFDHLLKLEKVDKEIKKIAKTKEEREELWALIDEIIHHRVMGCVLDQLPRESHEEFLDIFEKSPHDEQIIFDYLKKKVGKNVEEILEAELGKITTELLETIASTKK